MSLKNERCSISTLLFLGMIMFLFNSCASKKVIEEDITFSYNCPDISSFRIPDTLSSEELLKEQLLLEKYTYEDLELANAFGLIEDLRSFEKDKKQLALNPGSDSLILDIIRVSSQLNEGTNLAQLEIEIVIDLIDCSILQLRKYETKLIKSNLKKQNKLSNWAIVTGAATTVLTAGILLSNDQDLIASNTFDWLAVAGGLATTFLAINSSKVDQRINLNPSQNFVEVIWNGDNSSQLFPLSIWHLMNVKFHIGGRDITLRDKIIEEWMDSEAIFGDTDNLEYMPILLADKGVYNAELIEMRLEMLQIIAANLDQVDRALYLFNSKRDF